MPEAPTTATREQAARVALAEVTDAADVGELLAEVAEADGVTTLSFATTRPGYPGWRWTVAIAELPGEGPSVLEVELLPGEGALLAPDWLPWSERLEEYRAAQAAAGELAASDDADDSDDDDDIDDDDDDDELDKPGVDLRELIDFEPDDDEPADDEPAGDEPAGSELLAPQEGVEQQDEPDAESGDADPDPVAPPTRRKRWMRRKKNSASD